MSAARWIGYHVAAVLIGAVCLVAAASAVTAVGYALVWVLFDPERLAWLVLVGCGVGVAWFAWAIGDTFLGGRADAAAPISEGDKP